MLVLQGSPSVGVHPHWRGTIPDIFIPIIFINKYIYYSVLYRFCCSLYPSMISLHPVAPKTTFPVTIFNRYFPKNPV